jgi:hypothetical protein
MNIIKIQNQLKGVPDDTLVGYVQNPTGQVPTYLALSELQRRKEMRSNYQANKPEDKTVAEDLVQEAEPQPGIAALPEAQPMMEAMQPPEEMPVQQMAQGGLADLAMDNQMFNEENYATGGIVAFDDGGPVQHYAYGGKTKTDPELYDPSYYKDAQAALIKPKKELSLEDYVTKTKAAQEAFGVDPEFYKSALAESKTERVKELEDAKKMDQAQLLLAYGSAFAGTPTFGGALAKGGEKAGPIIGAMGKTQREINSLYKMADRKTLEAQQAQARGDAAGATKAIEERDNINTNIGIKNAELETSVRVANAKGRASGAGSQEKVNNMIMTQFNKEFLGTYPQGSAETVFQGNPQFLQQEKNRILNNAKHFILSGTTPAVPAETQFEDMYKKNKPVISGTPKRNIIDVPGKGKFRQIGPDEYEPVSEDEE